MNYMEFFMLLENIRNNYIFLNIQRFTFFPRASSFSLKGVKAAHFARGSDHKLKEENARILCTTKEGTTVESPL